jgi:hypothetical protein
MAKYFDNLLAFNKFMNQLATGDEAEHDDEKEPSPEDLEKIEHENEPQE